MQNNIKVWIESSTLSFDLNSHDEGVYLISDLDGLTSLPSIRTSAGVNAGTDGGWTSAQAFDARLISLSVVIANEDVSIVESKRRLLNSLLAQSRKETLKLHFTTEAGMEFIINVRITAVTGALTNILKKQELLIQMRADDPIIYGAQGGEGADATLLVQQTQSGFEIPFEIPLLIGGGSDKVDVEDLGTEEVYPIIKMTGPLHNPTVVNETQNAEIGVNADLGDMEWRGYQSAELLGNTAQQTYTGKNKANIYAIPNQTGASLKINVADGKITISDNANIASYTNTTIKLSVLCPTLQVGDTVYLFFDTTSSSAQKDNIYIQGTGANIYWGKGTSKTITQAMLDSIVVLYGGHDETAVISNFMITATNDSTYEKYVGGIPSPNPNFPESVNTVSGEQTVKITGKNPIDPSTLASSVFEGDLTNLYYYDANLHFALKAGQTYTLSAYVEQTDITPYRFSALIGTATGARAELGTTPNLTTVGGRVSVSFTVSQAQIDSAGGNNLFMRLPRYTSPTTTHYKISDIQLELGSTTTTYEPYQGQSYTIDLDTIELCKIGTYQDYIYKSGDKWYKHEAVGKINMADIVGWATSTGGSLYATGFTSAYNAKVDITLSNIFTHDWTAWAGAGKFGITSSGNLWIMTGDTSVVDTNVSTWLTSKSAIMFYILATPTDTEITDSELVGQLEALLNYAPWYGDDQNVFLIPSAGAQGELILGAHNEPKPADEVLIDTHLKTVTLNGQNAYPLLKDGSSFFSLAPGDNIMYLTSDVSSDTGKAEIKFKQGFISI